MGQKAKLITGIDTAELVQLLNEALAEEWLATYQYWIGARVMEGPMRAEVEPELLIHANQEMNHAVLVVNRIIQLGGTPILTPADWFKFSKCAYEEPADPYIEVILQQNLNGERCAINRYSEIANLASGKDHATHQMAVQILNEEIEHEQDIEDWMNDIKVMKDNLLKLRL